MKELIGRKFAGTALPNRGKLVITTPYEMMGAGITLVPDRNSFVCKHEHSQNWTITHNYNKIFFCISTKKNCEICDKMESWKNRVKNHVMNQPADSLDPVSIAYFRQSLGKLPEDITLKLTVEYLVQENQYRPAACPWSIPEAKEWLDGKIQNFPLTNLEKMCEGHTKEEPEEVSALCYLLFNNDD
jgi:hypothetical protein